MYEAYSDARKRKPSATSSGCPGPIGIRGAVAAEIADRSIPADATNPACHTCEVPFPAPIATRLHQAVSPPSITRFVPVTQAASSEAR